MNEQEKKAIEKLKKIIEDTIKANECGLSNNDFKEEIEVYDTVLNLITKRQKEIEDYKYLYEQALDNTLKADKENLKLKKQINLMALAILNYDDQLVINRYKNIDEVKETFKDLVKKGE